MIQPMEGVEI